MRRPLLRSKVWHDWRHSQWLILACALLFSLECTAYSYSAKGKEVLLEGRTALLTAMEQKNPAQVETAMSMLQPEIAYLEAHHGAKVSLALSTAVTRNDSVATAQALDAAFAVEIARRLDAAEKEILNYQSAKVLVVKSKLFLDLLQPRLNPEQRKASDTALRLCLSAIGNPGVFGVGKVAPDLSAFQQGKHQLLEQIQWLNPPE